MAARCWSRRLFARTIRRAPAPARVRFRCLL
jgi:hypothetical protein